MFYNCPNCQQLIKEDADTCPFCKHIIKVTDMREKRREEARKDAERIKENMKLYSKRTKLRILVFAIFMFLLCALTTIVIALDINKSWIVYVFGVLVAIYIILLFNLSIYRCPYCDNPLNHFGGQHCEHCGGRLW